MRSLDELRKREKLALGPSRVHFRLDSIRLESFHPKLPNCSDMATT